MESAADAPRETIKTPQQAAFFHLKTRFLEILGLSPLLPAFLSLLLSLGFAKKEKKKKKKASLSPSSSGADSAAGKKLLRRQLQPPGSPQKKKKKQKKGIYPGRVKKIHVGFGGERQEFLHLGRAWAGRCRDAPRHPEHPLRSPPLPSEYLGG